MLSVSQLHDWVSKKITQNDNLENETIYIFTFEHI